MPTKPSEQSATQAAPQVSDSPALSGPGSGQLWALIPCAGAGVRAGTAGPKQYQPVAGKPMVLHTLAAFSSVERLAATLVVVSAGDDFFQREDAGGRVWAVPCGGATRAQSVANGLQVLRQAGAGLLDWVLVHDAARCLITPAQISALIDACEGDAVGGLLALKLPDTLKQEKSGRVAATIDRSGKWLAQTPQMFRIGALQQALATMGDAATDESSAMEMLGLAPLLVEGSAQNFKVTYPQDFALADAMIRARSR